MLYPAPERVPFFSVPARDVFLRVAFGQNCDAPRGRAVIVSRRAGLSWRFDAKTSRGFEVPPLVGGVYVYYIVLRRRSQIYGLERKICKHSPDLRQYYCPIGRSPLSGRSLYPSRVTALCLGRGDE